MISNIPIMLTGKHGCGKIMFWGFFSSAGTEDIVKKEGLIDRSLSQHLQTPVRQLKNVTIQHNNNAEHKSKINKMALEEEKQHFGMAIRAQTLILQKPME